MIYTITRGKTNYTVDQKPICSRANAPVSMWWGPTIRLIQNGGNKSVVECLVCGSQHSFASNWPKPVHLFDWIEKHRHDYNEV